MSQSNHDAQRRVKSYVLRQSKITTLQKRALEEHGPRYAIPFQKRALNFTDIFGNTNPVILEIGFGMGHATAEIAQVNPDKNYVGVEVHRPGVGALLDRIHTLGLSNLRIIHHDAVDVLAEMIADSSLSGIHVFFPDPWQKKKHFKRRLIQVPFLESLAQRCRQGAYLYLVSDWEEYAQWMLDAVANAPSWSNSNQGFSPPVEWRPQTSFERKGLSKDHKIREILAYRA